MGGETLAPVLHRITKNVDDAKLTSELATVDGLRKSVKDFENLLSPELMNELIGIFLESTANTKRLRRNVRPR